jgi:hypothetical protein
MNDTALLITGVAVFCLMLIGMVLTALEFNQLNAGSRRDRRKNPIDSNAHSHHASDEQG